MATKEWLRVYETRDEQTGETIKTSKLKIFNNCEYLIKYLPQVQKDEKRINDISDEPHEYHTLLCFVE